MNWYRYSQVNPESELSDEEEEFYMYEIERDPPEFIDENVAEEVEFRTETYNNSIIRIVSFRGQDIGETEIKEDKLLERSVKKIFPQIAIDDKVYRFYGIYLAKPFRNKKIGKKMIMDMFQQKPDAWFANSELGYSGSDIAAIYALESLQPKIEVLWLAQKGGLWAARLAKFDQEEPQRRFWGSGLFLQPDYVKTGSKSIIASDLRSAMIQFLSANFVPTYISWDNYQNTWKMEQKELNAVYRKLYELVKMEEYSVEQTKAFEWVKDYMLRSIE